MISEYLKSAYTELFGNFPSELELEDEGEKLSVRGKATEKEIRMLRNLHKCTLLSVAYLTTEDVKKTKPFVAVSRLLH